jgi:hypothetical protein
MAGITFSLVSPRTQSTSPLPGLGWCTLPTTDIIYRQARYKEPPGRIPSETDHRSRDAEGTRLTSSTTCLEAHNIAGERLEPKALGRNKPVTENDTPLGGKSNQGMNSRRVPREYLRL